MSEEKANILVVDDVPERLLTMQAILEDLGENVITASSGREALRQLLERDFAVILLDVNMPDMDGFETAAMIRRRRRTEHTPILFVTAFSDEAHALQGYSLGAVDYILAPVAPEVLRTKVGVFVELFKKAEQVRRHADQRVALVREQTARASAEEMMGRSRFLAEASHVLAESLDYDATLDAFAHLVLPKLADQMILCTCPERFDPSRMEIVAISESAGELTRETIRSEELPQGVCEAIERMTAANASQHAAKHPRSVECSNSNLLPLIARGRLSGVVVLCRDAARSALPPAEFAMVQELVGRAAMAIDNARLYGEIQTNDRRKDEFLAMLGHELRNPLGAIAHAVECIRMFEDDPIAATASREVLERQVLKMKRMVDDLLDVSRITRGKIELDMKPVELSSVVKGALATAEPKISARGHRLITSVPADPIPLLADPTRLEQIVGNLLDNASKYTEPGGEIHLLADRQQAHVILTIKDTGIGIAPTLLPHVFDLFAQGDCSLDRAQGGLGIGLTLVKRLVELHGGAVEALSEGPGQGSSFVVRLPLAKVKETAPPVEHGNNGVAAAAPRKILVVDDNADLAAMTAALLRRTGHDVRVAEDGPAALEAASACHFDAALIDIGLPGMNGYELAERLQTLAAPEERPLLVAMTGYGQEEDRRRSRAAGFDHHLVKPIEFKILQQLLAEALSDRATQHQVLS